MFLMATTMAVTLFLGGSLANSEVTYAEPAPTTQTVETTPENPSGTVTDPTNPLTPEEASMVSPDEVETTPQEEVKSCSEQVGAIGWLVCPVTGFLAQAADWLFGILADLLLVQKLTTDNTSSTYIIWNIIRDLSNIIFIILIMVMVFSQVTSIGISNYGVKKILPRLAAVAIIINLSYFICAIFVDLSNIVGGGLKDIFDSVAESAVANSNIDVSALSLQSLFLMIGGGTVAGVAGLTVAGGFSGALILLIPVALSAVVALLAALFTMAARQAIVTLLVIVSPLAVCAFLLPNTEKLFKKWKDLLIQMLILYPMFSVLFGAAGLAGWAIIASATSWVQIIFGVAVEFVPLILTPRLLKMSNTIAGKVNDFARAPFKPLQEKVKNFAGEHQDIRKSRLAEKGMRKMGLSRFVTPAGLAATLAQGRANRASEKSQTEENMKNMTTGVINAKKGGRKILKYDKNGTPIYARTRSGGIATRENRHMRNELRNRVLAQYGKASQDNLDATMGDINKYADDNRMSIGGQLQGLSKQYKRGTFESVSAADQLKQITERNTNKATEQLNARKMGWNIIGYNEFNEPIYETNSDGSKRFDLNSRELRDEHITRSIDYRVKTQGEALENTMGSLENHLKVNGVSSKELDASILSRYSAQKAETYLQSIKEGFRKENIERADQEFAIKEFSGAYKNRDGGETVEERLAAEARFKDLISGSADSLGPVGESSVINKIIRRSKEIEDRDRRDYLVAMDKFGSDASKRDWRNMAAGFLMNDDGKYVDATGKEVDEAHRVEYDTYEEYVEGGETKKRYYFDMKDDEGKAALRIYKDDKAAMKEFGIASIAIGDPWNSWLAREIGKGNGLAGYRSTFAKALIDTGYNEHDVRFGQMMKPFLASGSIDSNEKLQLAGLLTSVSWKPGKAAINDAAAIDDIMASFDFYGALDEELDDEARQRRDAAIDKMTDQNGQELSGYELNDDGSLKLVDNKPVKKAVGATLAEKKAFVRENVVKKAKIRYIAALDRRLTPNILENLKPNSAEAIARAKDKLRDEINDNPELAGAAMAAQASRLISEEQRDWIQTHNNIEHGINDETLTRADAHELLRGRGNYQSQIDNIFDEYERSDDTDKKIKTIKALQEIAKETKGQRSEGREDRVDRESSPVETYDELLNDIINNFNFNGNVEDFRDRVIGLFSSFDRFDIAESEVYKILDETIDENGELDIDEAKRRLERLIDEFHRY
jgi:hypothetical protein